MSNLSMADADRPLAIRKTVLLEEALQAEAGRRVATPVTRVVGIAVLANPFAGEFVEDLSLLFDFGAKLGGLLAGRMVDRLPGPVRAYGKAAIVGVSGEVEHGAALIHPKLGRPVRAAIGGGNAIMPSNVKVGTAGTTIDVPLAHKDEIWSFDELDTVSVAVADAPRPDEIMLVVAISNGTRLNARIGPGPTRGAAAPRNQ